MPRAAAPPALLVVIAVIVAFAVVVGPVVEARPKDKRGGNKETVTTEVAPEPATVAYDESAPPAEQTSTLNSDSNERTLLALDADGDYLPDALDNCPAVQNPDQADSDGDGIGDACPVYQDSDGDGVADKDDNCPNIATYDFADRDGDGIGDACDKSPDGVEPEPEPLPDYTGEGEGATEPPPPESGAGEDGYTMTRSGRDRARERTRTETVEATIVTGADMAASEDDWVEEPWEGVGSEGEVITEGPDAVPYEPPARDNPRRNEELVAEAAASGELYAEPQPPPEAQRAWDEELSDTEWEPLVRIDAGATRDAELTQAADMTPGEGGPRSRSDASDSEYARGWARARLLLQEDAAADPPTDPGDAPQPTVEPASDTEMEPAEEVAVVDLGLAPVPVENGLVISNAEQDDAATTAREADESSRRTKEKKRSSGTRKVRTIETTQRGDEENGDGQSAEGTTRTTRGTKSNQTTQTTSKDGSRRNGSARAAAATSGTGARERRTAEASADDMDVQQDRRASKKSKEQRRKERRARAESGRGEAPLDWSNDRYFEGGSALDWSGGAGVAGTDDEEIYLTQRSGSGSGKRRGFSYAIPVGDDGVYLVRLYFAEPYWGAPGGPEGEVNRRVFAVSAEGDALVHDLDIFAEAGALTALVKQAEVRVDDGELNLQFVASEGEPIVAAIEVLQPAR